MREQQQRPRQQPRGKFGRQRPTGRGKQRWRFGPHVAEGGRSLAGGRGGDGVVQRPRGRHQGRPSSGRRRGRVARGDGPGGGVGTAEGRGRGAPAHGRLCGSRSGSLGRPRRGRLAGVPLLVDELAAGARGCDYSRREGRGAQGRDLQSAGRPRRAAAESRGRGALESRQVGEGRGEVGDRSRGGPQRRLPEPCPRRVRSVAIASLVRGAGQALPEGNAHSFRRRHRWRLRPLRSRLWWSRAQGGGRQTSKPEVERSSGRLRVAGEAGGLAGGREAGGQGGLARLCAGRPGVQLAGGDRARRAGVFGRRRDERGEGDACKG
mmetsp:Transcript_67056/g.193770  ORF Transcript_67056/g.193770 Transcript_67056/m.193770 type:complete len:321 (-) Transcript_67056:1441-2403(-)